MVSMWYAMREALAIVAEEGLEAMWARHESVHKQMWEGLRGMGLEPFVKDDSDRLVTVNTIKVRAAASRAAPAGLADVRQAVCASSIAARCPALSGGSMGLWLSGRWV
jgi:aspartate aminotransferase-like enzyme